MAKNAKARNPIVLLMNFGMRQLLCRASAMPNAGDERP
jgi:hypothetical protein